MDWAALVDGPLPDVLLGHVPALVVQGDAPGDTPLQVDVLAVADAPSDTDVLTVAGEVPMQVDDGDPDVDLAGSSVSSASAMSCENCLSSDSSECAPSAIDEGGPRECSEP